MADVKLKDRRTLRRSEYATAIMGAVSDDTNAGETRKFTIAELAEILATVAPATPTWERTPLFEGNAESEEGSSERTFSNTVHNLGFKSGSSGPRHDFTDGYTFFNVGFMINSGDPNGTDRVWSSIISIPSISLLNATETEPLALHIYGSPSVSSYPQEGLGIAKNSDTSFKVVATKVSSNHIVTDSTERLHITKIEGLKMVIQPSSL